MLTKFKDFFNFNATERNGAIVLFVLIVFIAVLPRIYSLISKPEEIDLSSLQAGMHAFDKSAVMNSVREQPEQTERAVADEEDFHIRLTPFDPNRISDKDWIAMGLKAWQVKIIMNYRSKGGKFRTKEDVGKIYGINADLFKKLEPYIIIPVDTSRKIIADQKKPTITPAKISVDINLADTNSLQELKGIGPSFARRIVKYREMLGGFSSVDQLKEVYGFDEERFSLISVYCNIGNGPFRKMNLNAVSSADLRKHPYMNYTLAKAIVDARIAKGKFKSVEELKNIPQITSDIYVKIAPYLCSE